MRDAFGGLFMIRLLLIFIFIYVIFAAISYNYAQAFRLKNSIISYIEENDIINFEELLSAGDETVLSNMDNIISSYTYNVTCDGENGVIEGEDELDPSLYCYNGIILESEEKDNIITYKVRTFVYMNLPLINTFYMNAANNAAHHVKDGSIQINGEAKVVRRKPPTEKIKVEPKNNNIYTSSDISKIIEDTDSNVGMGNNDNDSGTSVGMGNNDNNSGTNVGMGNDDNKPVNETEKEEEKKEEKKEVKVIFTGMVVEEPNLPSYDIAYIKDICKREGKEYEGVTYQRIGGGMIYGGPRFFVNAVCR